MSARNFDDLLAARGPEVVEAVERRFRELLEEIPLAAMRVGSDLSQADVASSLGISQAAVSKLESRGDMLLSTFYRYVLALGGSPRVHALVGDRCYSLEPTTESCKSFVLGTDPPLTEVISAYAGPSVRAGKSPARNKLMEPWVQTSHGGAAIPVKMTLDALCGVANEPDDYLWAA